MSSEKKRNESYNSLQKKTPHIEYTWIYYHVSMCFLHLFATFCQFGWDSSEGVVGEIPVDHKVAQNNING